jgi:hypothetical protein
LTPGAADKPGADWVRRPDAQTPSARDRWHAVRVVYEGRFAAHCGLQFEGTEIVTAVEEPAVGRCGTCVAVLARIRTARRMDSDAGTGG